MSISLKEDTIHIQNWKLSSPKVTEISTYLKSVPAKDRSNELMRIIEAGWMSLQFGIAQQTSNQIQSLTKSWVKSLNDGFHQDSSERLSELKDDIMTEFDNIRELISFENAVTYATSEVKDCTPLKGADFEAEIQSSLSTMASYQSDILNYVGDSPGLDGNKKGDFVYEHKLRSLTVAIEAKDLSSKMSVAKIEELIESMVSNRGTSYGIFVTKHSKALPDCFAGFYIGSNYIACEYKYLLIALKTALIISSKNNRTLHSADKVMTFVQSVQNDVRSLDELIKLASSAKRSSQKVEDAAKGLKESLEIKIEQYLSEEVYFEN